MRILFSNFKKGGVKVLVENADDLWYLSHLIDPQDRVSGQTQRKVKKTEEGSAVKKTIYLTIAVETVDLDVQLRVSGTVVEGPEDVPNGSYHSFGLEPGSVITLVKPRWYGYQVERIKEAQEQKRAPLLLCVFDREDALLAKTTLSGYTILSQFTGDVSKKGVEGDPKKNFYDEILAQLEDYDKRYGPTTVILASPSFWREELLKRATNSTLKKKFVQATCSSVTKTALDEVLKRPEVREALAKERVARELILVEELLVEIAKNRKAAYGFANVQQAVSVGAVNTLLVTDGLISTERKANTFDSLDQLMKGVDAKKGDVHIISSEHDGGKKLDGLGGIGALLRFPIGGAW